MNSHLELQRGPFTAVRNRLSAVTSQSERTLMLGTVLLMSAVSVATGYFLTQCFSVNVLSSLLSVSEDCWVDWGMNIGRHCFSDYDMTVSSGMQPDPWAYPIPLPWQPLRIGYPAAAILLHLLFGLPAKWVGAPQLGLVAYLLALTVAVLAPAIWASRGARGLERVVVFVALGAAAIPAWAAIDRGNSAGFVVPAALILLVALCRERWGLVAIAVVLATLVKPHFALLIVVLFAARQWRWGGVAAAGIAISNVAAYLLWPQHFPETIAHSVRNTLHTSGSGQELFDVRNVAFGRALLWIPDTLKAFQTGGKVPEDFLAGPRSLIGYVILLLVVVSVLALGRRVPPVLVGIVLLATASLFPPLTKYYYLVFALPVAALVSRDPSGAPGTGIFDRLATEGPRRRALGIFVSLAAALTIAQVALPSPIFQEPIYGQFGVKGVIGSTPIVLMTTTILAPILWLIACAAILVSYTRRPAASPGSSEGPARSGAAGNADGTSPREAELITESSSQAP